MTVGILLLQLGLFANDTSVDKEKFVPTQDHEEKVTGIGRISGKTFVVVVLIKFFY